MVIRLYITTPRVLIGLYVEDFCHEVLDIDTAPLTDTLLPTPCWHPQKKRSKIVACSTPSIFHKKSLKSIRHLQYFIQHLTNTLWKSSWHYDKIFKILHIFPISSYSRVLQLIPRFITLWSSPRGWIQMYKHFLSTTAYFNLSTGILWPNYPGPINPLIKKIFVRLSLTRTRGSTINIMGWWFLKNWKIALKTP